jgi:transposase
VWVYYLYKKKMTEDFFDKLLNFGSNWKVEQVLVNELNEVDIFLKFDLADYKTQHTDTYEFVHDYLDYRRWRHLDILQYKTFINAKIPRIKHKDSKIKSIETPWAQSGKHHTHLFEIFTIDLLLATKNQTKTAQILRCGFNLVNKIMHNATQRGLERRDSKVIYKQLSLDEKSFKKGHNYVTVLSNQEKGIILDVVKDRTKIATKNLLNNTLSDHQISKVETISLDMWKSYNTAVDEILPNAKKVHDRFHLIKYLNEAIDNVRKREVKKNEVLRDSRYSFLKNKFNLTAKQHFKFEEVLRANTEVGYVWGLKESFKSLFGCEDFEEAFKRLSDWNSFVLWEAIPELTKVAKMFNNHIKGVCNALVEEASNAMAERLNGKIQIIKTGGRGYRKFQNFRSAILFFNGGLNLYPLN